MIIPVILSGGAGTRLWPLSRELYPKQLLPLTNNLSLLQNTLKRIEFLQNVSDPVVICNEEHRFLVAEQLRQLGKDSPTIILEPVGRNTAPATAVAALQAVAHDPDALLLVLPADHVLNDPDLFHQAIRTGQSPCEKGYLVTFGVVPSTPHTGYGYIKKGALFDQNGEDIFHVDEFVEKPDFSTAERYLAQGEHLWNSGMFLMGARTYLEELGRHAPAILESCRTAVEKSESDLTFIRLDKDSFTACPSDSIDYAVMEKTNQGLIIPLQSGWSDVGSWSALWESGEADSSGNVLFGDCMLHDVEHSYIRASGRLVAAVGVKDMVVVETKDAVLVASKDRVQEVKKIVSRLKDAKRAEADVHSTVYRPWGSYECIDCSDRFQVKRITVKTGQVLSLQMHHHRAEHWVVVKGTAKITKGDEELVLTEDQSTYIPLGTVHRLENPGKIPLELIEVQTGSYLGEDDIVRFEDVYGRSGKKE